MTKLSPSRAGIALAALYLAACAAPPPETADLVLVDGEVLTLGSPGVVEALAVGDGRVLAAGTSEEIRTMVGSDTRVVELGGRTVIPGLTDNHYHGIGGGPGVDLTGARSMADVVDAIAAFALETGRANSSSRIATGTRGSWPSTGCRIETIWTARPSSRSSSSAAATSTC